MYISYTLSDYNYLHFVLNSCECIPMLNVFFEFVFFATRTCKCYILKANSSVDSTHISSNGSILSIKKQVDNEASHWFILLIHEPRQILQE